MSTDGGMVVEELYQMDVQIVGLAEGEWGVEG